MTRIIASKWGNPHIKRMGVLRGQKAVLVPLRVFSLKRSTVGAFARYPLGPGGYSLIWAIRGCAAGQGMVFWPRCPEQGIQFYSPVS